MEQPKCRTCGTKHRLGPCPGMVSKELIQTLTGGRPTPSFNPPGYQGPEPDTRIQTLEIEVHDLKKRLAELSDLVNSVNSYVNTALTPRICEST